MIEELKGKFLDDLHDNAFSGTYEEDAVEHIKYFLKVVDPIDLPNVNHDRLRVAVFPISLAGNARNWGEVWVVGKFGPPSCVKLLHAWSFEVKKNDSHDEVIDDGFSDLEEANNDDEQEIGEIFRIETNLFNYETPLCTKLNEFNYLLKIDPELFTYDIERTMTYDDYMNELNNELEEPWSFGNFHELDYELLVKLQEYWWNVNQYECSPFANWRDHVHGPYANFYATHDPYLDINHVFGKNNDVGYKSDVYNENDDEEKCKDTTYDEPVCKIRRFEIIKSFYTAYPGPRWKEIDKVGEVSIILNPIGTYEEDAVEHIECFLKIVDPIDLPNVNHDRLRVDVFPISLAGNARNWFEKIKGSATTWVDLTEFFFGKYYLPSRACNVVGTEVKKDPTNDMLEEWLASKFANHMTMDLFTKNVLQDFWKKNGSHDEVIDDGFSDLEEANNDDEKEISGIFRIETNLFNYETPLCTKFNEFNYLLKIDPELFTYDIERTMTYDDYMNELNNELEEPWSFGNFHELDYELLVKLQEYWWNVNQYECSPFANWRDHVHGPYANFYATHDPYLDINHVFGKNNDVGYKSDVYNENDDEEKCLSIRHIQDLAGKKSTKLVKYRSS
ncbi:hypothetical protein Tco_0370552 [Tanacetum coccineum]